MVLRDRREKIGRGQVLRRRLKPQLIGPRRVLRDGDDRRFSGFSLFSLFSLNALFSAFAGVAFFALRALLTDGSLFADRAAFARFAAFASGIDRALRTGVPFRSARPVPRAARPAPEWSHTFRTAPAGSPRFPCTFRHNNS